MTIQTIELDPAAQYLTDDAVVGKINAATANITRANSVAAAARPIVDGEVTEPKLSDTAARDNLDAMVPTDRKYIKTDPGTGQFKVVTMQRTAGAKIEIKYDDVPVP